MPARALLAGLAAAQLQSGIDLIARLEDDAWTATVPPLAASTVGAHFRHVFDHVDALLAGLHGGIVDYDQRARDPRIEQDRTHALAHARRLGERLRDLGDGDGPVRVLQDSGERGTRAVADSTWARELQFVVAHPAIPSFIAGTRTVEQLRQNLAWFSHPIPADFWADLKRQGLLREDAPVPAG